MSNIVHRKFAVQKLSQKSFAVFAKRLCSTLKFQWFIGRVFSERKISLLSEISKRND
jgi:hypothetical protein